MTTYLALAGTYLTTSGRTSCRVCWMAGERGTAPHVISPTVWRDYPLPVAKRKIVAAAKRHYAEHHPTINLP